jgi:glucose-6-phosphate isomerase
MSCIKLTSGFTYDYGNLIKQVTHSDVEWLSERVALAHQAVCHMRTTGEVKGHLSKEGALEKVLFSNLPYVTDTNLNSPQSLAKLKQFGQSQKFKTDIIVHLGIGGSYLGNKVLFDIHCGEFWNYKSTEQRNGYPKLFFSGNNIDPLRTSDILNCIENEAKAKDANGEGPCKVTLVVVSKSGSTIDTMSSFMILYDALKNKAPYIETSVVAVTDPAKGEQATLLGKLADTNGWPVFSVPDGVGGRFSVFSEVGLITAACIGFDIDAFLGGARAMDQYCQQGDVWGNPALLNAVLKYILSEKYGYHIEIFMPYGDYLKSLAEWYIQLLAESLGKRFDRDGQEVFYGRTPVVAVGTTDMHSQTQQHQDGRRNKIVQFVRVANWGQDPIIPDCFSSNGQLNQIANLSMSKALDIALEANAAALADDNRPNATVTLPQLNAYHLGELMYLLSLSIAYEGELANVDAFDQPGVEAYKKIMKERLKK